MRILVTNDDGIDAIGLHVLARTLRNIADVVVAAPDRDYSGSGASLGIVHTMRPDIRVQHIDGIDDAWSVSAPPAMCAMFGRLGVFGAVDLVVAGINPGANVGRSIYHSGTVGACLTARNGGTSGVAVSQAVEGIGVEGQGWEEGLAQQQWQGAADVAAVAVEALLAAPPADPVVLNINVPNRQAKDMAGWRRTNVGAEPPRSMSSAALTPKPGHEGTFHVELSWGDAIRIPEGDDGGAVMAGYASVSWLGRIESIDSPDPAVAAAETALDNYYR